MQLNILDRFELGTVFSKIAREIGTGKFERSACIYGLGPDPQGFKIGEKADDLMQAWIAVPCTVEDKNSNAVELQWEHVELLQLSEMSQIELP
ncbi:hypothetical protein CPB97_009180 [Podila verticillata]|nr:hypothetical protein CPB97_009180 [Podila verticillata]